MNAATCCIGIKPYKCLFCQKAFSRRAHMVEHQQSHTDNYRFRSSTCNKGFTRQSYYRDHKCPAAGNEAGTAGGTGEAEGDKVAGVAEGKDGEDDGRRGRFMRKVKRTVTGGGDGEVDDSSKGSREQVETHGEEEEEEEGEEERRRTDEGCQAAMSITTTEEQTRRGEEEEEEDDGVANGNEALEQIQSNDQNCLQQPCL